MKETILHFFKSKALIIICILLPSLFYLDSWRNDNSASRVYQLASFIENNSIKMDKYASNLGDKSTVGGHTYSDKAPLPGFVLFAALPVIRLFKSVGEEISPAQMDNLFRLAGFILGVLPFLWIALLYHARLIYSKWKYPHLITFSTLFGSFLLAYSGTAFGHLFAAAVLLQAYVFLKKENYFLAGLFVGAAVLSEYILAVFAVIWFLQAVIEGNKQKYFLLALGGLPAVLFLAFYNYSITGSPFDMVYNYIEEGYKVPNSFFGIALPHLEAFWGLTFSDYRGLFFFCPLTLMAGLLLINQKVSSPRLRSFLLSSLALPMVILFLVVSSYAMWWGGWCAGPRHLTSFAVLLIYAFFRLDPKTTWYKWIFMLNGIGLIINILLKGTVLYSLPTAEKHPMWQIVGRDVKNGVFNPNNFLTQYFDVLPKTSFIVYSVGLVLIISVLFIKQKRPE